MKEVVRLLQSLPFHQAREAKDQVFRCWEAGALATGHQLRIVVFSGVLILFTNSFLLIKLKYEQLWPLGKDVLEGKYAVGLEWLAFQVYSVMLLFHTLGHCFSYEHAPLHFFFDPSMANEINKDNVMYMC